MKEITRTSLMNLIQNGIKRGGYSVMGLEKKAGVPKDTIRDFLRGKTQILRADKLQKLLAILEPEERLTISGTVGAYSQIFPMEPGTRIETVDTPPGLKASDVIAVKVKGDAMEPVFLDGWVVYYSTKPDANVPLIKSGWQVPYVKSKGKPLRKDKWSVFFGKPAIIKIAGKKGENHIFLRILKPASEAKHYHLSGYNTPDIKDVKIEWAAKILFIKPE